MSTSALFIHAAGPTAAEHRQLIEAIWRTEGVLGYNDLRVSERAAGANLSVDIAAGRAVVTGDTSSTQGSYLVTSDTVVNVTLAAADPADNRIDLIYLKIADDTVDGGGTDAPQFGKVTGTPSGSPSVPATPTSALPLATVTVAAQATQIVDSSINGAARVETAQQGLMAVKTFATSDTFDPDDYPGCRRVRFRVVGGGGASGDALSTVGEGQGSVGGGGGGGEYAEGVYDAGRLVGGVSVTVGAGGTVGVGGTSSVSDLVSAVGGRGGSDGSPSANGNASDGVGGDGGTGGTGGTLRLPGGAGETGTVAGARCKRAMGGGTAITSPSTGQTVSASGLSGVTPASYGVGAASASNCAGQSKRNGTAGAPGVVIAEVYG